MTAGAQEIVQALHGKWRGSYGVVKCPAHDDRSPSLRIRQGETGVPLVRCFAGCDSRDVIAALSRIGVWPEFERDRSQHRQIRPIRQIVSAPQVYQPEPWTDDEMDRARWARDRWITTVPAVGSIVERYWHEARGISMPIPPVIRFGAAIPYGYESDVAFPAMVAKVQGPAGNFVGIHVTYLRPDGSGKLEGTRKPKLIFGCVGGAAIRLADAACHLAIGEGIESTASYMQETKCAGWVGMNTSGLRSIRLPALPLAHRVTLLGENDEEKNGVRASAAAATAAACRMRLEGRSVDTAWPADEFKDFNDPFRSVA
jgi:putative DNA primase/helicase